MSGRKTIGSLLVRLGMDPKDAERSLKGFERNLKTMGKQMEATGRAMSIGFTAPFLLLLGKGIAAFNEEAQATRRLQIALRGSTKALTDQAAAIQKVSLFADDQIINQQAYAAALGHSEGQIKLMTTAAVGLASGLGVGLDQAMKSLHKSTTGLADRFLKTIPGVKELTAEQLKAGAAIELVNKQFAGFAEAAALTGSGPLTVLKNQFGDLMEQIGEAVMPIVIALSEKIKDLISWFHGLNPETKKAAIAFGLIVAAIGPMMIILPKLISFIGMMLTPTGLVTAAIIALGVGILYVVKNWDAIESRINSSSFGKAYLAMINKWKDGVEFVFKDVKKSAESLWDGAGKIQDVFGGILGIGDKGNNETPARAAKWHEKNTQLQGPGEFFKSLGGDIFDMLGGSDGQKTIDDANKKMEALAASLEKVGGGFEEAGEKAKHFLVELNEFAPKEFSTASDAPNWAKGGMNKISGFGSVSSSPDLMQSIAGKGLFGGTDPLEAMKGIKPGIEDQITTLDKYKDTWMMVGSAMSGAIDQMGASMKAGEGFFASFAKAVLHATAAVIRAMLMETLAAAVKDSTKKAGLPGLIIGTVAGVAAISVLEGLIDNIGAPKMAKGGMTNQATMAMIGDNPSGKEMVLPFERTGEFATMIGKQLSGSGGGGATQTVRITRDELLIMLHGANEDAKRMGSSYAIK